MRTHHLFIFILLGAICVEPCLAQESLATCSKRKTQQLELMQRQRGGHATKSRKRSSAANASRKIEELDVWLWKNCRSHAAELRTLEQQAM